MVRKKIAMAVLALSALQADIASALGLGSVAVKSSLNQPLNAEIRLLDVGELDETQIRVQLASNEDFQRAGVERDYFLTNLRFSIELDQRGNGVIRVTTREAVIEPYLNFIVETRWPSGRLLREYAVLLDPPTFSAAPVAPATGSGLATVQQRAQTQPAYQQPLTQQPAVQQLGATPRQQLVAQPTASGSNEYRVQHNDTLSSIAARFRPANDVNLQQTMVAIQQANPNAFIRGNINLVKSGYVLRIPAADAVRAISDEVAAGTVRAHNDAWRSGGSTPAEVMAGPQLDARRPTASAESGPRERERLSIASAGDSSRLADDGAGGAGAEALRNELTMAQESLDSTRRENEELNSRLDDMERQIATLQRLLTLKDDELAALQATAGEAPAADAERDAVAQVPPAATAPAAQSEGPASQPASGGATPAPTAPSFVDSLMASSWLPIAGGAALLLLLAALVVAQRRRAAAEREALAELEADTAPVLFAAVDEPLELDEAVDGDDSSATDSEVGATVEPEPVVAPAAAAEPTPTRAETGDAIAEADIYMAYGRYQQAVDLLQAAIEQEPTRSDLRVKLLEVYVEMRERDAFRAEFRQLQALGDESAVAQVKEILSSVDGVADWLDDHPGAGDSSSLAAAGFGGTLAAAAASSLADDDEEFVFDTDEANGEGNASEAEGELLLDLDLDALDQPPADDGESFDFDDLTFDSDRASAATAESDTDSAATEFSTTESVAPESAASTDAESLLDDLEFETDTDESRSDDAAPLLDLDLNEEFGEELGDAPDTTPAVDGDPATLLELDPLATPAGDDEPAELELDSGALDSGLEHGDELDLEGELDLDLSELEQDFESLNAAFGETSLDEIEPSAPASEPAATSELSSWSFDEAIPEESSDPAVPAEASTAAAEPSDELDDLAAAFDDVAADLDRQPLVTGDEPATPVESAQTPAAIAEFDLDGFEADGLEIEGLEAEEQATEDELSASPALSGQTGEDQIGEEQESDAVAAEGFDDLADIDLSNLTDLEPYTPEVAAADADDEFDFLADADEVATKLDLARAYIDMGDTAGARDILDEVVQEGTEPQKEEAQGLLSRID